jgi:hypothetical protein
MLETFPTTIEEDMALLQKKDIGANTKVAIEYRLGKKRILHNAVQCL